MRELRKGELVRVPAKRTITWRTLRQRVSDGVVTVTEIVRTKGKLRAQVVDRNGRPLTVRIVEPE